MRLSTLLRTGMLVLSVGGGALLATLYSFNHFQPLPPMDSVAACTPVSGVGGLEDLQIDHESKRLLIATFDRQSGRSGRGSIFSMSIEDPLADDNWRDRTAGLPAAFRPVSISLYARAGVRRLFVVNAATKSVEIFDVAFDGALDHLETLTERRLTSPSSIVATGPDSFYVSNDLEPGRESWLGKFQFIARVPSGKIFHFDRGTWRVAAEGLSFANGLALSADGRRLFAAETAGMTLKIFDRDPSTGALWISAGVRLPGAATNIRTVRDGATVITVNPRPLSLLAPRRSDDSTTPSLVMKYQETPFRGPQLVPIFQSAGEDVSRLTTADLLGHRLFVGGNAGNRFLMCDLDQDI